MDLTIVTICYNAEKTIEETIASVRNFVEEVNNRITIEYLIIDGDSNDKTVSIIKKNITHVSMFVSEKDLGIYDAMNKALRLAKGSYIWYLNADDYIEQTNLKELTSSIESGVRSDADIIIGDIEIFENVPEGIRVIRKWNDSYYGFGQIGWHPPHPGFICKVELLVACGGFDILKPIAADFKAMIKCLTQAKSILKIKIQFTKMRAGGNSNGSISKVAKANVECYTIYRELGVSRLMSLMNVVFKLSNKLNQRI